MHVPWGVPFPPSPYPFTHSFALAQMFTVSDCGIVNKLQDSPTPKNISHRSSSLLQLSKLRVKWTNQINTMMFTWSVTTFTGGRHYTLENRSGDVPPPPHIFSPVLSVYVLEKTSEKYTHTCVRRECLHV